MIDLHFTPTANGQKISIALEDVEIPYRLINYDIFEGDHHTPEFRKINPNQKVPAIVDHDPPFGGGPHAVFESGAILQYIAEKTGKLLPKDPRKRSVAIQWLTWQVAGLGPMGGQAAHFLRYAPERIEYAIDRYLKEHDRLMRVLDRRLGEEEYIAGDEYTIADIAVWPARSAAGAMSVDLEESYPNVYRGFTQVAQRPGVIRGRTAERAIPEKYLQKKPVLNSDQWSHMFGERLHQAVDL